MNRKPMVRKGARPWRVFGGRGRPLRFLALVVLGWICMRVAVLWPDPSPHVRGMERAAPTLLPDTPGLPVAPVVEPAWSLFGGNAYGPGHASFTPVTPMERATAHVTPVRGGAYPGTGGTRMRAAVTQGAARRDVQRVRYAMLAFVRYDAPEVVRVDTPAGETVTAEHAPARQRWSGSAWVMAREGDGVALAPGAAQLGGGQAGVRVVRALGSGNRLALAGRITTSLSGPGREAALGIEWQPVRAPLRLVVEQRATLDAGSSGGPGIGLIAGEWIGVAPGIHVEGYGQAGVIARARREPYVDAAVRVTGRVLRRDARTIDIGVGSWAAAQRDARRFDIGLTAVVARPFTGIPARVSIDWRRRVAGDARPGSGAVLTLGADF